MKAVILHAIASILALVSGTAVLLILDKSVESAIRGITGGSNVLTLMMAGLLFFGAVSLSYCLICLGLVGFRIIDSASLRAFLLHGVLWFSMFLPAFIFVIGLVLFFVDGAQLLGVIAFAILVLFLWSIVRLQGKLPELHTNKDRLPSFLTFRPEDSALLNVSIRVCRQLGLETLVPITGSWVRLIPSDQCSINRHRLLLPIVMMTKLDAVEWEPIMTASIIYLSKISKGRYMASLFGRMSPLLFSPLLLVVSITVFQLQGITAFSAGMVFVLFYSIGTVYGIPWIVQPLHQAALESDREAARILGRMPLLDILKKIDELKLQDVERRKRRGRILRHSEWPSITERIANLQ